MTDFPGDADHRRLHADRIKAKISVASLSADNRRRYHAYDYGWRRVLLDDRRSPLDPEGEWFDAVLADQAERYWRIKHNKPTREEQRRRRAAAVTPAEEAAARGDYERAALFRAQDRERAALKARIVGDGKLPDGRWSPEAIAYSECCWRQAKANLAAFGARLDQQQQRNDAVDPEHPPRHRAPPKTTK